MISAILILTLLVGNSTGSFAGGLTGSLALAAAALTGALLQRGTVERFNMRHGFPSSVVLLLELYHNTIWISTFFGLFSDHLRFLAPETSAPINPAAAAIIMTPHFRTKSDPNKLHRRIYMHRR